WKTVALPPDAGRPTDIARFRGGLVTLTERGLWRVDVDPPARLAAVDAKRSPFAIADAFCAAPLAVFRGDLYAGDQRDGSLWRRRAAAKSGRCARMQRSVHDIAIADRRERFGLCARRCTFCGSRRARRFA